MGYDWKRDFYEPLEKVLQDIDNGLTNKIHIRIRLHNKVVLEDFLDNFDDELQKISNHPHTELLEIEPPDLCEQCERDAEDYKL